MDNWVWTSTMWDSMTDIDEASLQNTKDSKSVTDSRLSLLLPSDERYSRMSCCTPADLLSSPLRLSCTCMKTFFFNFLRYWTLISLGVGVLNGIFEQTKTSTSIHFTNKVKKTQKFVHLIYRGNITKPNVYFVCCFSFHDVSASLWYLDISAS